MARLWEVAVENVGDISKVPGGNLCRPELSGRLNMSGTEAEELMSPTPDDRAEAETSLERPRSRSRRSQTNSEGKSTPLKQYNLRTENAEKRQADYLRSKYSDYDMVVSPKKSPRHQRKR